MQPLSIVAAFGLLGMVSMVGALMVVMSSRRMLRIAGEPSIIMARVTLPANVLLLTLGLLILALGVRGMYRLIWVT